ncbi:MAG TPA: ADOP family duplicated permease [Gemmatimonadaceae bacterium]|nr:ADOP family duplicated permease [Gemmatimonadaceae bacterium]
MSSERLMRACERWLRLLLHLYPADFRDEMGESLVETYRDRCAAALRRGSIASLAWLWLRALGDSLWNGLGERMRPAVDWRRSGNWGRDMELVMRRLVRSPVFVLSMVGTLTVGLGAFAVVSTVVDKVLIAPLPYAHPQDLYFVWRDYGPIFDLKRGWLGGTDVAELQRAGGVIEGAAGLLRDDATLSTGVTEEPEDVRLMMSSPNLFELLGVRPMLGRGFSPDEVGPGRPPVVVLSYDLWKSRFGANRSIVGSQIRLNGRPYTVIGVMGRDFHFVENSSLGPPQGADAYITFDYRLAETSPSAGSYAGLIRARAGTAPQLVAAAVSSVGETVDERDFNNRGLRLYPVGAKSDLVSAVRPALVVLGLAGVFLVLVLLLNLATLLLVRAAHREREFAVSRALGANGFALTRATLLEGGFLGLLGGAAGALVAVWGTRLLVALAPVTLPRRESIVVDWGIAAVVIGIGALLGLLAAAVPAAWAARTGLAALLNNAAVRGGGARARMRRVLVVVQVALSLVLLSAGGLVVRSFARLLSADPGFEPAGVLTLQVAAREYNYPDDAAVRALHAQLQRAIAALPGVTTVGVTSALPLSAEASQTTVYFPGAPGNNGDRAHDHPLIDHMRANPDYFRALGIHVLAGRTFSRAAPDSGAIHEAVIDRTLAARFFPTGSPLGRRLLFGRDSLTVVGVVDHARQYDIYQDDRPQVYLRDADYPARTVSLAVRTGRDPLSLVPEVRAAIRHIDAQLAVSRVRSMDQLVGDSLRQQRLSAVLIAGFSLAALLLAAMGLFGVVSGSVTRRRHELAIRLALGADHGRLLRQVLAEGALLVLLGLLVGVPGIYLAGRTLGGMLVGISPFDPVTLCAVAAGLVVVAMAACYLPARRVTAIEPARSLRED